MAIDACTRDQGSADLQLGAVADGQHLVDHDLLANVRSNLFYLDLFAGSNLVLLATGFYDRVHISPFNDFAAAQLTTCQLASHSAKPAIAAVALQSSDTRSR